MKKGLFDATEEMWKQILPLVPDGRFKEHILIQLVDATPDERGRFVVYTKSPAGIHCLVCATKIIQEKTTRKECRCFPEPKKKRRHENKAFQLPKSGTLVESKYWHPGWRR